MSHSKKRPQKNTGKFSVSLMTIRKWHWMSSALCFICILLFSFTGITLNHAGDIEASPATTHLEGELPPELLSAVAASTGQKQAALPEVVSDWFAKNHHLKLADAHPEINDGEIYLSLARPGGDAWLSIDGATGEFEYESTDRGWIAYFNDLHKGRNTGKAWVYFMDLFAIACIIFSLTGFLLLQRYADTRAQTWPLLIAGLVAPLLFMVFLIHK
ncbi:MAG TPA: PepSY-associated TM helix domain-containing protein [Cellvibrio sp.]|nr:PepSY-associated TM helix domain-containing protein [Cellvibrio sp.]